MKLTGLIRTTFAFVIVSVIIGAVLYNRLPDPVPTGFMAKPASVFLTPVAIALLGFLFAALPRISPKGYRLDSFLRVYEIIAITVLTVEFVDGMLGLYIALGHDLDVERVGTAFAVGTATRPDFGFEMTTPGTSVMTPRSASTDTTPPSDESGRVSPARRVRTRSDSVRGPAMPGTPLGTLTRVHAATSRRHAAMARGSSI